MSYLLLKNRNECPHCRAKRLRPYSGQCVRCGVQLFLAPIDFWQWEADGLTAEWWLFNSSKGWMHRSHIMMGEQPLENKVPELVTERNTKTAEQRVAEVKSETREKMKQITPRRN